MNREIKTGDWVVRDNGYRYETFQVERVTDAQVRPVPGTCTGYGAPKRADRSSVLFSGLKADAFAVAERLTSSKALASEEKQKADQRHRERVAKITKDTTHD